VTTNDLQFIFLVSHSPLIFAQITISAVLPALSFGDVKLVSSVYVQTFHLKEGQKCPVCGSVHHPELAKIPDEAITEEAFNDLKVKEEALQSEKSKANTAAETAKTSLKETENRLQSDILDCLKDKLLNIMNTSEELDDLIKDIKDAQSTVKDKIEENTKQQEDLEKDSNTLKKSEDDLEKAQGQETDDLRKGENNEFYHEQYCCQII
jgi:exonuclease SbcC